MPEHRELLVVMRLAGQVPAMEYSRQYMVDLLRHAGLPHLAEEAARELPDPVDAEHLEAWETRHGISRDDLISRFGGGP